MIPPHGVVLGPESNGFYTCEMHLFKDLTHGNEIIPVDVENDVEVVLLEPHKSRR